MKKFILLISILTVSGFAFAQQPPNASFESWTGGNPVSWYTTNMSLFGFPVTTVLKDNSNPQHLSASAQLRVVTTYIPMYGTYSIPGVMTTAEIIIDPIMQTFVIQGGYPFTGMPNQLSGYFKYQPVGPDTCTMGWALSKWQGNARDTIGFAFTRKSGSVPNWTYFEIPLEYNIWENPDTMNILFLCSNPLDSLVHTNTKLWIDNLAFMYGPVKIEGVTFGKDYRIYADALTRNLVIASSFAAPVNALVTLFDISGREMKSVHRTLGISEVNVDIGDLRPGNYVVRITSGGRLIDSRKITIGY